MVKEKEVIDLINTELKTDLAKEIFPKDFRNYLLTSLKYENAKTKPTPSLLKKIKNLVPKPFKRKILKKTFKPKMDISVLNFRAFLILRMIKLLKHEQNNSMKKVFEDFDKYRDNE